MEYIKRLNNFSWICKMYMTTLESKIKTTRVCEREKLYFRTLIIYIYQMQNRCYTFPKTFANISSQISHMGDPIQRTLKFNKLHTLLFAESLLPCTSETNAAPEASREQVTFERSLFSPTVRRQGKVWNICIIICIFLLFY